jgi:acyl dehydratase
MIGNHQAVTYEDVQVGQELPQLEKGPLTTAHLMRWSSAMENWHKIHYDLPFTVEHDKLPGLLINGSLKQQFLMQILKDWVGPSGWVWKVSFQFRAMNIAGETLRLWGRVTDKREGPEYGLVSLELGIVNDKGTESTPGKATIALPYRGGPAVPYPFVPPAG